MKSPLKTHVFHAFGMANSHGLTTASHRLGEAVVVHPLFRRGRGQRHPWRQPLRESQGWKTINHICMHVYMYICLYV